MRIITILLFFYLSFLGISQITDSTSFPTNVTSYNSIYKGYRGGGMIFSDTITNARKEFFTCCFDNEEVMYYTFKSYHENGELKLDSSINMMSRRKAKIIVIQYDNKGKVVYMKKLSSRLEINRTELPKRKDILWNGKVVILNQNKKVTQHLKEITQ